MDPEEQALVGRLRDALSRDPIFSPLPELSLARDRLLGEGGMGVVHLVTDARLGRKAALKVAKRSDDPDARHRFLREARITAHLDHPGIPPVYEAGRTSQGELFMLLRFVDGRSLRQLLRSKERPSVRELLAILVKVGEAVAYAHSRRVIHRDLKPANIMVGSFGEVLVMDWGLARSLDESAEDESALRAAAPWPTDSSEELAPSELMQLTSAGAVLGTVSYMSPEQARGEEVDARTDVFALGAVLTEIVTGDPPIAGVSFVNKLKAAMEGRVVFPSQRRKDVAPELDAIARRALAPRREDRYEGATQLADDVRAFLEGRPVSVYRETAAARARRLARAHPALFASVGVAIAASTLAAALLAVQNVEVRRRGDQVVRQRDELERRRDQLAETIAALESEKRERSALERARSNAERARALRAEARTRSMQGAATEELRRLVRDALAVERTETSLIESAALLDLSADPEGARELLVECSREFPPAYRALFLIADVDARQGRAVSVIFELLARARERGDDNEFVCLAEAVKAAAGGDHDAAVRYADKAVSRAPTLGLAWLLRGQFERARGDTTRARADYDRAVEVEPWSDRMHQARGGLRYETRDLAGAIADLTAAIRLNQRIASHWADRGRARRESGDGEGAVADYSQAIFLAPEVPAHWIQRGEVLVSLGESAAAARDFEKVLELAAPGSAPAARARRNLERLKDRKD